MGWAAKGGKGKAGGKSGFVAREASGKGKSGGGGGGGDGGNSGKGAGRSKPTDDPEFVRLSEGAVLRGSELGVNYVVEAYVASGTFSRVYRVREAPAGGSESMPVAAAAVPKRHWVPKVSAAGAAAKGTAPVGAGRRVFAAKVMRPTDEYIQYSSNARKEGELLRRLERRQLEAGRAVLTMRCVDAFAVEDDGGSSYYCLILEWLDLSLFDVIRATGYRGLHLSVVAVLLRQLFEQLLVLQESECTHTDIKHKNCCLADGSYFLAPDGAVVLARPEAKFIDYGNATFEGEAKTHPIHTKQFRAPEVLLNIRAGWGPPSDTWTLGVTAVFLVCGQLIFNSHDPSDLVRRMVEALGPFPPSLLDQAQDARMKRVAESAASGAEPSLAAKLGLQGARPNSPEAHCTDLLRKMLAPSPVDRICAAEALRHPFLAPGSVPPLPERPAGVELRSVTSGGR